jgi:hypothetical protein
MSNAFFKKAWISFSAEKVCWCDGGLRFEEKPKGTEKVRQAKKERPFAAGTHNWVPRTVLKEKKKYKERNRTNKRKNETDFEKLYRL